MGIKERLRKLEAELGPKLCEARHCLQAPTYAEVIHYPDGAEEQVGRPPVPIVPVCQRPERTHTAHRGREALLKTDARRCSC
jgi:hypothetical protein